MRRINLEIIALLIISTAPLALGSISYSGGSGTPADPYKIASPNDLLNLAAEPNDYNDCFILAADINLAAYTFDTAVIAPDTNLTDLNYQGTPFSGTFDGNDRTISNLNIDNNSVDGDYLALFGQTNSDSVIKNLNLKNATIIGDYAIAAISAENYGTIKNCIISINLKGFQNAGGICSHNFGKITNCSASGSMSGSIIILEIQGTRRASLGGIILGGICAYNIENALIENCISKVDVNSSGISGSFCGFNWNGYIENSFSTGNVKTSASNNAIHIGGFTGQNKGWINNCYSTGSVTAYNGAENVGGFCGSNNQRDPSWISNCYSTGDVTVGENCSQVGGFCGRVGWGSQEGIIDNCYSTSLLTVGTGTVNIGAFCGNITNPYDSKITNCYYLNNSSYPDFYAWPLTHQQMLDPANFINFDFTYSDGDPAQWFSPANQYPILTWQISPFDIYLDGKHNLKDFAEINNYWLRTDCAQYNDYCNWTDLDYSGSVDIDDLIKFMTHWLEEGIY